jgi:hypothetical protein
MNKKTINKTKEAEKDIKLHLQEEAKKKAEHLRNKWLSKDFIKDSTDYFYYGPPVSPKEFVESTKYYGNSEHKTVFPWVIESLEEIFSGEYYQPKYNTAVFVAGKGSGKSYLSSFALAYMWYWHHCFKNFRGYLQTKNIGWDGDSAIAFMGMAPSADKAKDVVFNYTKKNILKTKLLQERGWLPDPDFTSRLQCYYEFGDTCFTWNH